MPGRNGEEYFETCRRLERLVLEVGESRDREKEWLVRSQSSRFQLHPRAESPFKIFKRRAANPEPRWSRSKDSKSSQPREPRDRLSNSPVPTSTQQISKRIPVNSSNLFPDSNQRSKREREARQDRQAVPPNHVSLSSFSLFPLPPLAGPVQSLQSFSSFNNILFHSCFPANLCYRAQRTILVWYSRDRGECESASVEVGGGVENCLGRGQPNAARLVPTSRNNHAIEEPNINKRILSSSFSLFEIFNSGGNSDLTRTRD